MGIRTLWSVASDTVVSASLSENCDQLAALLTLPAPVGQVGTIGVPPMYHALWWVPVVDATPIERFAEPCPAG